MYFDELRLYLSLPAQLRCCRPAAYSNTGGGLHNNGQMYVHDSAISDNAGGSSGGIANAGTGQIERSTIADNSVGVFGGGILVLSGDLELVNATVSGNEALTGGGGIIIAPAGDDPVGVVSIEDSTITGNWPHGLADSFGGMSLLRTIVAANDPADCVGGGASSLGFNLDLDGSCGLGEASDLPAANPRLGPLMDNGGETFTHALPPTSPAVDAVGPSCSVTDQRGALRSAGADCDIGAYKYTLALVVPTPDRFSDASPSARPTGPIVCRIGPGTIYPPAAYFQAQDVLRVGARNQDAQPGAVLGGDQAPCWVFRDLLVLNPAISVRSLPLGLIPPTPTWTPDPPTETPDKKAAGCWYQGDGDNQPLCYDPCPPQPDPGGACTP